MPRRHAIAEGDALETGRASAKVAFRVLDVWSAQEGSGDLIVRLSAILMIHAILGAGAMHSASVSAKPMRPEMPAWSAPTVALVPCARCLAIGTAHAGGTAGARRRGRASASLGIRDPDATFVSPVC
jgi:hypothetical protein